MQKQLPEVDFILYLELDYMVNRFKNIKHQRGHYLDEEKHYVTQFKDIRNKVLHMNGLNCNGHYM